MLAFLVIAQSTIANKLVDAARDQISWGTTYDPSYVTLKYPGGDVERSKGVCTDVIIRAYRRAGIDLQKLIIEDKKAHLDRYPKGKVDPNIDHRRVKNMAAFFRGHKASYTLDKDWRPGDMVYWILDNGRDHIGLVTDRKGPSGKYMVVHNMSQPLEEDVLGRWKIVGHYRYPRS